MSPADLIVSRSRLFVATVAILTTVGAAAWLNMPRQEDPQIPDRAALIVAPFPGAGAEEVERLVVRPLEDALGEVPEIDIIHTTARANVAVIVIELLPSVSEVDPVYDEVERRLDIARRELPDRALEPMFDRRIFDQESILIAITGTDDRLALADAADRLERRLLAVPEVSRVVRTADPGEQITVELDDVAARRVGIDPRTLAGVLAARSAATPGGTINAGDLTVTVQPNVEFGSVEEIAATPVTLVSGSSVPLSELARVVREPEQPESDLMRWNGETAIAVGVVARPGINLLEFGDAVDAAVRTAEDEVAPLAVDYVTFQPERVASRLGSLGRSLLGGVGIVALVLLVFMGPRLGLTVAGVVPVVTLSSLAIYAMCGGILHQMSIASLVLALGLLVDNAIVVAENVQRRLDAGVDRWRAARDAVSELALPLGAATGTTLAAFVPMLLAVGPVGDFTRALPIVIMLTLSVSYVVAITVTPAVSAITLRPNPERARRPSNPVLTWVSRIGVQRPVAALLAVLLVLGAAVSLAPRIRLQFFPTSDRNQVIIDVELPEGTHVSRTDAVTGRIEDALATRDDVVSVAAFVGRGVPHFYYNLVHKPDRPHLAQIVVETRSAAEVTDVVSFVRDFARSDLPGVDVVARRIEQGPPIVAPIEIRVYADDFDDLQRAAREISTLVSETPGAVDVRDDLAQGTPTLRFEVDDAVAARHGLAREDVAIALLGNTRGLEVGQLRSGADPAPIIVRQGPGELTRPEDLDSADVSRPGVAPVPVAAIATPVVDVRPAAIRHRNRVRTASVSAQLADGATYSDVLRVLTPRLDELTLPGDVRVEIGGEAEGSGDANSALLTALPIGVMLLLVFLMGEFNSFRAAAIVLATVPLAAAGVVPGLALTGQPFGFMSMLGVFALIGIVVNNAIVLLDVVGRRRADGASVDEAVRESVLVRTRPILLTTATTVAGLLPLALADSPMWPPLAWAMISGLVASTLLTLVVVPALYRLLHREPDCACVPPRTIGPPAVGAATLALTLALGTTSALAQDAPVVTLEEARAAAAHDAFDVRAASAALDRAALLESQARTLWHPTVNLTAAYRLNGTESRFDMPNPYGPLAPWLDTVAGSHGGLPPSSVLTEAETEPLVMGHQHDPRGIASVTQTVYSPRIRPLIDQALAAHAETEAGADAIRFAVDGAVVELYFGALRQHGHVTAMARNVELATLNLERAEVALRESVGGEFEVNRAQVALARAERNLGNAEAAYSLTVDALAELLDRPPDFDVVAPPELFDAPADTARLDQRPELRRLEEALGRHDAGIAEARARALPVVQLQGEATAARETEVADHLTWHVQIAASWDLYDAGVRRVTRRQREHDRVEAEIRVEQARASLDAEVRRARIRLREAERDATQASREAELAVRNVEVTREAFAAGAAGFVDVETAQTQRLLAEVALADAEIAVQRERYQWRRLTMAD